MRKNSTKILISAGSAVIIVIFFSSLRVSGGLIYRIPLFNENPITGVILAMHACIPILLTFL